MKASGIWIFFFSCHFYSSIFLKSIITIPHFFLFVKYKFKGKSFNQVFNKPIDFGLNENGDIWSNESRLDKYGVHCCWATVDEVIEWLELYVKEVDYGNAELLLSFCYLIKEQIKNNKWGQVCVVHYGY